MRKLFLGCAVLGICECYNEQQPINSGLAQPLIGFGTWNLKESPSNTSNSVAIAIQYGYRQIDCAAAYGNEKAVGRGIADGLKSTGLRRDQIWVTSKLWNDHHSSPDRVEKGLNQTLLDLDLDYLDLYLMHWPVGKAPDDENYEYDYVETWHAMEKLLATGRTRNIGVSNFSPRQLRKLIKSSSIRPEVHQMELHPYLQQTKWVKWHQKHGISVTAYSPLGNTNPTYGDEGPPLLLENKVIKKIAKKRGCAASQVALAWGMRRGTSVIPKSKHEKWIKENYGATECVLEMRDIISLKILGKKQLTRFNNPSKGWGVHLFEGLDDA